jgi:branched-chain amino acid transport system ATP-binding protein
MKIPILEVHELTKYFGGLAALKNVSFTVPEQHIFGFIGPNGAGKTTLFNMIAGAMRPSAGRVVSRGKDVTGQPPYRLFQAGIARTHQLVCPLREMTVLENVQVAVHFGRKKITRVSTARDLAMQVLHGIGLDHCADRLAGNISFGDQKRLELARALAGDPQLLLCDEICGGLTRNETLSMLGLLRRIRDRGTTIMYVEHDVKAIMAVCDRIVVLNYGEKLAEGQPEEIRNHPAVIEAYLGHAASRPPVALQPSAA